MAPSVKSLLHAAGFVGLLILVYLLAMPIDAAPSDHSLLHFYGHELLLDIGIAITLAVSLNLILGIAGQFSLGHAGFVAAGAFTAVLIAGRYFEGPLRFLTQGPLHFSIATGFSIILVMGMLAGAAVSAILGLLVGLPTLRLRGDYLAIATLGFGEILAVIFQNFTWNGHQFFGGSTGLSLIGMRGEWLANQPDSDAPFVAAVQNFADNATYYVGAFPVFALALLTIYIVRNIKYATSGRALLALREDGVVSEAVGVPTTRYKVAAFVVGATLAGLAGGLVSHHKSLINPESFRFMRSIELVAMVILGGQGSITGSVIAAILLTLMPEALRMSTQWGHDRLAALHLPAAADWVGNLDIEKWRMVFYSLFIILSMLFRPQGLFGRYEITEIVAEDWHRWRRLHPRFARLFIIESAILIAVLLAAGLLLHLTFIGWVFVFFVAWGNTHWLLRWNSGRASGPGFDLVPPIGPVVAAGHVTPGPASLSAEGEGPSSPVPLLTVGNVIMQFGGLKAVDNFSLTLLRGELVGLIGPNGAGKTTVFNVLTGVYRPTAGDITIAVPRDGLQQRSLVGAKPHTISRLGIARTFQNIRLFANLSVLDNVRIAQHAHHKQGIPAAILRTPAFFREEEESRRRAMGYLDLFNLAMLAGERANALSYGDQRRLEIARALATRPRILLLDEPAAGMNPTEKRELMDLIRSLRTRFGLTILLIEHDMKVVMGVCQRILVLDYGKTIAAGTPEEIRKNPAVIEAYLGTATPSSQASTRPAG